MVEDYLAKIATCNVCGKQKKIVSQRNRLEGEDGHVDIYLECEDCVHASPSP
jgi:hypothetical protein